MNESQGSSLAGQRAPAPRAVFGCAVGLAFIVALTGCGQKGPLFLPAQAGPAARPEASAPSAPEDGRPAAPPAPLDGASSPGLPPAAR